MLTKTRITTLALTAAIGMTGAAEAAPKAKLTIKGQNGDFHGTIKAKKRKCMNEREVRVFMVTDRGPQQIGSDTSELDSEKTRGLWSTGNSGYKNGEFFAKAAAKGSCRPLRSKTITVVTPDSEEEEPETLASQRSSGQDLDGGPRPIVTETATALEVDGVPGGYSRQKCERLLQQFEEQVDKAADLLEQGNYQGPLAESAASYLEQASETQEEMSDNCLVVQ